MIAVVGSLTVLPAMLALLGDRIDRGRILGHARRSRTRSRRQTGVAGPGGRRHFNRPWVARRWRSPSSSWAALAAPLLSMYYRRAWGENDVSPNTPIRVAVSTRSSGRSRDRRTPPTWSSSGHGLNGKASHSELAEASAGEASADHGRRGRRRDADLARWSDRAAPHPDPQLKSAVADHRGRRRCGHEIEPAVAREIPGAHARSDGRPRGQSRFHESPVRGLPHS